MSKLIGTIRKNYRNLIVYAGFLFFWVAGSVSAQIQIGNNPPPGGGGGGAFSALDPLRGRTLGWVVTQIATFLLYIAAPISVIMVLVGGFQMMTSGGDPQKFSTGKKTLVYAAVGFIVILLAQQADDIIASIFSGI